MKTDKEDVGMTIDKMMGVLPETFVKSDVISDAAKKVMAALFHLFITNKEAQTTGQIICPNYRLRDIASIGKNQMRDGINELIDHSRLERIPGKKWEKGKEKVASIYRINFELLDKPIKEKTFDDYRKLWEKPQAIKQEEMPAARPSRPMTQPINKPEPTYVPPSVEEVIKRMDNATTKEELERLLGHMYGALQDHSQQHPEDKDEIDTLYSLAENNYDLNMQRLQPCEITSLRVTE